ncbi:MogA/MoaB family molybdenum cofactor biosynthesis protein [Phragmitibacter flavus]|uniref:Molybdopterin adenylyltransferase n=1 Tax=Phragmitibacter flavus TaxID=2576071 RepID=A0A5R8KEG8_9BACT|nr:MogA/MoaB family molybdenum cofactor biosynthesis protein [Phragmitibacter flavus]TLD70706.1 MogA/MoaB family molybdenum cofactor biosynthesis protein [Phragmitibacter flavus]
MNAVFQSPLVGIAANVAPILVGIVTVSDRASAGEYEDQAGPALQGVVEQRGWKVLAQALVPDEIGMIQQAVKSLAAQGCGLVLTTGGTGMAERDVTPEALRGLMRVELPGFGELMRMRSVALTPNAILSRCLAVVVEDALVIALPGKPQGAVDCLGFVSGAVPHAVKLARREPTSC